MRMPKVERRAFLKAGTAAAGGLILGVYVPEGVVTLDAQLGPPVGAVPNPHAFIRIGTDDVVTLIVHKPDNGQGTETSIAMLLAETTGLRVQTTAPSLGAANVRINGLRGRYTQLLADGLPLYGSQGDSFSLLQVPPLDLSRVEIAYE